MGSRRELSVLHLDIDAFFAAVEVLMNPSLRGKPVVVGGMPWERGVVSTASYEARKYGVHSGMPLRRAGELCPNCVFLRGHFRVYREFSEKFFRLLYRYTPHILPASLDEAYLDLSSLTLLYPDLLSYARRIKEEVERDLGLSISGGLARNRLLAKLATERAKPGGFFVLHPGDEEDFLGELPMEALPGIGHKTREVLLRLGIKKVRDLRGLSLEALRSLFGLHGEYLYYASRGEDVRGGACDFQSQAPPRSLSRETTFLEDLWDLDLLLAHLSYLSDRLASGLREEGLKAGRIGLKVRFSDFTTITRSRSLRRPTDEHSLIYEIARELFMPIYEKADLSIRLLGVTGSDLRQGYEPELFERRKRGIQASVDLIRRKFGFGAILTARELKLSSLYSLDKAHGYVLKTASLTR